MTEASPEGAGPRTAKRIRVSTGAAAAAPHSAGVADILKVEVAPVEATLGSGLRVVLRKPNALVGLLLAKAIPSELADKPIYMNMIQVALYVGEIDGEAVSPPRSEAEFDALIMRLGEDMDELVGLLKKHFTPKSVEEEKAAVKK